jgi:hypothetical protein
MLRPFCFALGILLASLAFSARVARCDTILIFESSSGFSIGSVDSNYGSRVTSNNQGGFLYGGLADTPNVVATYGTSTYSWPTQYGDLQNVAYTAAFDGILRVTLAADPGFLVAVQSFDLAGWPSTDYTIRSVQVTDGDNHVFYSNTNLLVQGDTVGPRHTTLNFSTASASVIKISIDASNLTADFGAQDVGLDNLRFSQATVPEPATATTALLAACCLTLRLARVRWRSRANRLATMR